MEIKRLTVRSEQMEVMEAVAAANFEHKLAASIRSDYADSNVRLPEGGESKAGDLGEETLAKLVHSGVIKARSYDLTLESSISGFVALMFAVAPSFDRHRLCEVLLGDEEKPADARVEELLNVLTEKNWDAIRSDYDPEAWIVEEPQKDEPASEDSAGGPEPVVDREPERISAETFMTKTKRIAKKKVDPLRTRSGGETPAADLGEDTTKIER